MCVWDRASWMPVKTSKNERTVDEAEFLHATPKHAQIRLPSGHETTVLLCDIAPLGTPQSHCLIMFFHPIQLTQVHLKKCLKTHLLILHLHHRILFGHKMMRVTNQVMMLATK